MMRFASTRRSPRGKNHNVIIEKTNFIFPNFIFTGIGWGESKLLSFAIRKIVWANRSKNNRSMKWWSYGNNCPNRLSKPSHHDDKPCKRTRARGKRPADDENPSTVKRRLKLILSFSSPLRERKKGHWIESSLPLPNRCPLPISVNCSGDVK